MKRFTIDICAYGSAWERDVNCPPGWRGSGCYDVEYTTRREGWIKIGARNLDEAIKEIPKATVMRDYDVIFYDPSTVIEEDIVDDEDETDAWEIDHEYEEEEVFERECDAEDGMDRYCEEVA